MTEADVENDAQHEWQRATFTGAVTCRRCGLMPMDPEDLDLPCEAVNN